MRREIRAVRQAMAAAASADGRTAFLRRWCASAVARRIGADPVRRGRFAALAGFTGDELGLWNAILAGIDY